MSIPKVSVRQIKAARALLDWSQSELANRSGVSTPTIKRLEVGKGELGGRTETVTAICAALEAAGVVFLADGEMLVGGPGVRLRQA